MNTVKTLLNKPTTPVRTLAELNARAVHNTKTRTLTHSQGRIVVLGSGWAGFKFMKDLSRKDYEVTVVSPRNYFVFTPLLASTSVGTLEFRCATEPVRGYSHNIDYHQAWCDKIDIENQVVHCTSNLDDNKGSPFTLDYDKLIISVGSYSNTFGIPGVKEHGLFLKDIQDARKIRARFEYAAQPGLSDKEKSEKLHFAVVGGGPTGVEFSSELHDFISEDLSRLYPQLMAHTRMTLYDVAPQILGTFDQNLSAYATRKFARRGIQIKTGRQVLEVMKDRLIVKDDGEVPFGMLVWSTGLMQNPLVESCQNALKDAHSHRLMTDSYLRVLAKDGQGVLPNIYAMGDCATIKDHDLPATAQVAQQKAQYLGDVFNKAAKNGLDTEVPEFSFHNRGSMAYIGSWEAVVDMTPVHKKASEGGHLAWFFWRSAYLSMSVSFRNKMLIPMFWFLTWMSGRDITKF
ncbi:hypothetical protein K450DRAFT_274731 [Umbelopsis ramanniana AG]|uniref:FAD/NAD(P)-binding domain-containing protein n=1 Tax=Umbelopsis ramanniana AG TaxID=1314678 RepID=A0AAD5HBP0_UMBRA|nr:uncharacterized protein K450DRAFT_274731 [Umbelopsis ramanniana AG]KAI8576378.1 hypothetical protein K450DRAFT_274731 [Umbelopsis ramanniana AG]